MLAPYWNAFKPLLTSVLKLDNNFLSGSFAKHGLETFYDTQKSTEFETVIQEKVRRLDEAMRTVYLSPELSNLRSHPKQPGNLRRLGDAAKDVSNKTENIRLDLYVFVRCFNQGQSKEKSTGCNISEIRPG